MIIPAAMYIESAVEDLHKLTPEVIEGQIQELKVALGADVAKRLDVDFPASKELITGYCLGLQTARAVIAQSTT